MATRATRCLALAISVLGLWVVASPAGATSQRPASAMGALEQGVLSDINGFRRDHNLAPLRFSPKLAAGEPDLARECAWEDSNLRPAA